VPDPQPRAETKVVPPPGETQQVRMNQADMKEAARETRGRFYTLANAGELLKELPTGVRVTAPVKGRDPWLIWSHALLLVVALLFLTAEWVLRKRYHLL
jgi:hypothetical protein